LTQDDPTKIIITPNSGNETAGLAGEFTFTVAEGVIEDLVGNKNAAVNITLNVQEADTTPPTLVSLTAYVGEETRVAKDNTLTWTVGETVTKIEAVASEPVRLVDGANAVVTMSEVGDNPRITDAEYGTIAVDKDDPTKIIITPNSGNETAGLAGEFTFTVAEGVIEDLAGNKNAAVNITLNVQEADTTPPTLVSLTAYVGEETRVAEDNTLTWTVGETVTKIEAAASEPVRLVDGANCGSDHVGSRR
jgi:hypothetical protein